MADDTDDDIGDGGGGKERKSNYRVPPPEYQFQPGKSGNPRGRPKGALGLKAELQAELNEYVTITVNGKQKRIRKRRLIIKALAARAAKGDVRAAEKLLALVIQAEGFEPEAPIKRRLTDNDQQILEQFLAEPDVPDPTSIGSVTSPSVDGAIDTEDRATSADDSTDTSNDEEDER